MARIPVEAGFDPSIPQNLTIRYGKSWTKVIYNMFDVSDRELFSVKAHSKSLEFFTSGGLLLGTCAYHNFSSDIDVDLSGQKFTMSRNKGLFNETKSFDFDGEHFTWKRAGKWKKSGLWNLLDQKENAVAIFGHDNWKMHSRFELVRPGMKEELVLAIFLTGMAELEAQRRVAMAGAASASGSAAAGAAAAASA